MLADEGEGIDPNAAFVKKNKKKKADSASVSQSKSDITNPALSGASSKKQADSTDVSMALILLPLQKLFTIVHRQPERCVCHIRYLCGLVAWITNKRILGNGSDKIKVVKLGTLKQPFVFRVQGVSQVLTYIPYTNSSVVV